MHGQRLKRMALAVDKSIVFISIAQIRKYAMFHVEHCRKQNAKGENMKVCGKCKIEKDDSEFYKNSKRKDGLNYYCKLCHKEYSKEYKKTEKVKNPETF